MQIPITQQNRLLIQGAMDSEINILIENLSNLQTNHISGFPFYEGYYKGLPIIVMKTFQGMVNAAASTMLAIQSCPPAAIINQGVCGGHDERLHRGDIILGETIFNYSALKIGVSTTDNPIDACQIIERELVPYDRSGSVLTDSPASGGADLFYSDADLLEIARAVQFPGSETTILSGTIASADSWIDNPDYMRHLSQSFHTLGEDMESAAVAQLCTNFEIPFLSVRALSNALLHNEDFDESTAEIPQKFILEFLEQLI